jgi:hypothetical protein
MEQFREDRRQLMWRLWAAHDGEGKKLDAVSPRYGFAGTRTRVLAAPFGLVRGALILQ